MGVDVLVRFGSGEDREEREVGKSDTPGRPGSETMQESKL